METSRELDLDWERINAESRELKARVRRLEEQFGIAGPPCAEELLRADAADPEQALKQYFIEQGKQLRKEIERMEVEIAQSLNAAENEQ
jgi:hypothetical protein